MFQNKRSKWNNNKNKLLIIKLEKQKEYRMKLHMVYKQNNK